MTTQPGTRPSQSTGRPLTRDELAQLADDMPAVAVPAEVAEALAQPRLALSSTAEGFDPREYLVREKDGGWIFTLPQHASLGRPQQMSST